MATQPGSWYRCTTWTSTDREQFFARWQRARSDRSKSQYLRIQAITLSENGLFRDAIELFDRVLEEFPDDGLRGQSFSQRALCHERAGLINEAMADYELALHAETSCPNVRTTARLDYSLLIVELNRGDLFDRALALVMKEDEFESLSFPTTIYAINAVRAWIAAERGQHHEAVDFAKQAIGASKAISSGITRHPTVGLVSDRQKGTRVFARLLAIAEQ